MLKTSLTSPPTEIHRTALDWQGPVQPELELVEKRLLEVPEGQHDLLTFASTRLLASGGKRIRPTMHLLAAGLFDNLDERAISVAAAVEMLHTATLVHDDLIDRSLVRRGVPTLNADISMDATVLAGDYIFARSASLVAEADSVRVMDLFAKTLMTILNGEINQRFSKWKIDREIYDRRIYAKTAAMFVLASQTAAVLSKADPDIEKSMVEYGHNIGMAFQIVDDVLDFTGNQERVGKPIGSDLIQGIITLPVILYVESNGDQLLPEAIRDGELEDQGILHDLVEEIRISGAVTKAIKVGRMYTEKAKRALVNFPPSHYRNSLSSLADYIIERDF